MMRLSEAAAAIQTTFSGVDAAFTAVSTDSRSIQAGQFFVAIKGDRFDGHGYVADVLSKGAAGALVDTVFMQAHPELPLIGVGDTRSGFAALAAHWRRRFSIPVIGVVGSNGKTTAKEMCAAILRAHFGDAAVLATAGNLNNDIGLPTMALRLQESHRAAVLELGMNHPGETVQLAQVAQPTVALINNAQREHQEFMLTVRAVAEEHALLLDALPPDGVAVFNADDDHADFWRQRVGSIGCRAIGFGLNSGEVRAQFVPRLLGGSLMLATPWGQIAVELHVPGAHNARNACGAAAACLAAGVTPEAVAAGLSSFRGVKGRLQERVGRGGARVIDDTYNANPDSMRAAIDVLAGFPGRRIFVMGDMGEVGDNSAQMHDEVGGYARSHGMDRLLCHGEASRAAAYNFGTGGDHFERIDDLISSLEKELGPDTTVLVKGSRFMRMERVADAISENHHVA
jgi:UDP-N-acetylmuramoyl-tripeptide--D-alanyl-D-alanine ligase